MRSRSAKSTTATALIYSIANLQVLAQERGDVGLAREYSDRILLIHAENGQTNTAQYARTLVNRGNLERLEHEHASALQHYREASRIMEEAYGPTHPDIARVTMNLGLTLHDVGRDQEARPVLEGLLRYYESHPGNPAAVARARYTLAKTLWSWPEERPRARALARDALERLNELGSHPELRATVSDWLRTHRVPTGS